MKLYKVCINHDPGMTLTYLTASKKMSFNGRKLARNEQMDIKFMLMIIF